MFFASFICLPLSSGPDSWDILFFNLQRQGRLFNYLTKQTQTLLLFWQTQDNSKQVAQLWLFSFVFTARNCQGFIKILFIKLCDNRRFVDVWYIYVYWPENSRHFNFLRLVIAWNSLRKTGANIIFFCSIFPRIRNKYGYF